MMRPTTRDMSDAHENFLARILDGRKSRGSGNQFNDQMDGRNRFHETAFPLAWDGKSTLSKSVGVTLEMWAKAAEQAGAEIPLLALRFYTNERLTAIGADLVTLSIHDFVEILDSARKWQEHTARYDRHGQLDDKAIDDLVGEWHQGVTSNVGLHTYLGMTFDEYATWVEKGFIPQHLRKRDDQADTELPQDGDGDEPWEPLDPDYSGGAVLS